MFSTFPSTAHYIRHHATARPQAWAVHCADESIGFAKLDSDLRSVTESLRNLTNDCKTTSIVEVCIEDLYLNWLVLLGLENLGICSSSVVAVEHVTSVPDLWPVSLILCTKNTYAKKNIPTVCVDRSILTTTSTQSRLDFWPIDLDEHQVIRVSKTSGTTGSPKRIAITRGRHDGAMVRWQWLCSYSPQSVCWVHAPFSVGGMYSNATACLRSGGSVVLSETMSFGDAMSKFGVTHATLLPIELSQILKNIDALPKEAPKVMLTLFGGAIPLAHFEQALATFASDVVDIYGTNEIGLVGIKRRENHDDGLVILPGVVVDIRHENGQSVGPGEVGFVRVRTLQMIDNYIDAASLSIENFQDGWFWPGDLGHMTDGGLLKILGRHDDLLNLGGVKVNPDAIEAEFKKLPYVADVAVVMKQTSSPSEVITIAIVPAQEKAIEKMNSLVASTLKGLSNLMVVEEVASIPRTATGKVERQKLKAMLSSGSV